MKRFLLTTIACLLATVEIGRTEKCFAQAFSQLIASFETPEEIQKIKTTDARVSLVAEHVTEGKQALKIEFQRAARPSVQFPAKDKPWDWSQSGGLAFDLTNPSDEDVDFVLRIDDAASGDSPQHSVSGHVRIAAHRSTSFFYPLGASTPMEHGMRGGPPFPEIEPIIYISRNRINEAHITAFQLYLDHPTAARTLILDNVRLLPSLSYVGIVDAFGQYTRAEWPGKIREAADLVQQRAQEETTLQAAPALPDRDEYGGWASGPEVQPTGFFATTQREDKWWLVTPRGHLFFSLGVDVISIQDGFTLIEGREKLFTWLPAPNDALARHYSDTNNVLYGPIKKGKTFNFYTANLERKYGADYLAKWRSFALDRLRAWGFNTIANWSDPALFEQERVPYTPTIDISGDYARVASGQDYWGEMHDPFDPKFAAAAERSIRDVAQKYRDDPWCLGYFIDNEMSWGSGGSDRGHYGLALGTLAGEKGSPAKRAFVEQLKLHYRKVQSLNHAWGTPFSSWDALLEQSYHPDGALTPQMKDDFSSFLKVFAQQYFRVVRDALKRFDPNHLYLGCRFAWRTPEAAEAAAEYCDVVSFNIYRPRLDAGEWAFVNSLHRPCIIGEFHFGALDRGMFHPGLVSTPNQEARAAMYQDYIRTVVDTPAFVGCAWFQYYDEPLTGRTYDGENYNIGMVTATDTPYAEIVEAAKRVHAEVYTRRARTDNTYSRPGKATVSGVRSSCHFTGDEGQ